MRRAGPEDVREHGRYPRVCQDPAGFIPVARIKSQGGMIPDAAEFVVFARLARGEGRSPGHIMPGRAGARDNRDIIAFFPGRVQSGRAGAAAVAFNLPEGVPGRLLPDSRIKITEHGQEHPFFIFAVVAHEDMGHPEPPVGLDPGRVGKRFAGSVLPGGDHARAVRGGEDGECC